MSNTNEMVKRLEAKVEGNYQGGGNYNGNKNEYLPLKQTVPKAFGSKIDHWLEWKDDIIEYVEAQNPGMKELMIQIEKLKNGITTTWMESVELKWNKKMEPEGNKLWRALKNLTEGDAQKMVKSVQNKTDSKHGIS